jgi:hypothetical protein
MFRTQISLQRKIAQEGKKAWAKTTIFTALFLQKLPFLLLKRFK